MHSFPYASTRWMSFYHCAAVCVSAKLDFPHFHQQSESSHPHAVSSFHVISLIIYSLNYKLSLFHICALLRENFWFLWWYLNYTLKAGKPIHTPLIVITIIIMSRSHLFRSYALSTINIIIRRFQISSIENYERHSIKQHLLPLRSFSWLALAGSVLVLFFCFMGTLVSIPLNHFISHETLESLKIHNMNGYENQYFPYFFFVYLFLYRLWKYVCHFTRLWIVFKYRKLIN